MIGPSTGNNEGMQNREASETSGGRAKRKIFGELGLEHFCDEECHQVGKKRNAYYTEVRVNGNDDTIVSDNAQRSVDCFTPMSLEEYTNSGSVARLEVLVVDGAWDDAYLSNNLTPLTDHQSTIVPQNGQCVEHYGDVSYWENLTNASPNSSNANSVHHPTELPPATLPAEDQENGNLSWLLDFKLDSLIESPEDKCSPLVSRDHQNGGNGNNRFNGNGRTNSISLNSQLAETQRRPFAQNSNQVQNNDLVSGSSNVYATTLNDSRNMAGNRFNGPKKPPFTYTELIEHALQERGELTVSAIYQWISEHFPYYKSNDDRWKNSVRHNLSINPHFRKGSKAPHGAGHLWAIANRGETRPRQNLSNSSIALTRQTTRTSSENNYRKNGSNSRSQMVNQIVTMDEVAAATASIQQPEDETELINSVTMEHCAEQILSGIKRDVEVQYIVPMINSSNDTRDSNQERQQHNQTERNVQLKQLDFLNPVSKETVAEECGLIGEGYLVTDLNPAALGLNMVDPDTITSDLFGEELSFQFYELTSPSQLQSA